MSYPPPPPPPPGDGNDQPGSNQPGPHQPGGVPPQYPGGSPYPSAPQYPGAPQYSGHPGAQGGYPQNHPSATTILVLAILGIVLCAPLGVVAWVMGNKALKEIDSSGLVYANRGTVQAGRIIGIIATVFLIIGIVLGIVAILGGGLFAAGGF